MDTINRQYLRTGSVRRAGSPAENPIETDEVDNGKGTKLRKRIDRPILRAIKESRFTPQLMKTLSSSAQNRNKLMQKPKMERRFSERNLNRLARFAKLGKLIQLLEFLGNGEMWCGWRFFASAKACVGFLHADAEASSKTVSISQDPDAPSEADLEGAGSTADFEFRWSAQTDRNEGTPGDHMYMLAMMEVVFKQSDVVKANGACAAQLDQILTYQPEPMARPLPGLDHDGKGFLWVSRRHLHEFTIPNLEEALTATGLSNTQKTTISQTIVALERMINDTDANDAAALAQDTETSKSFYILPGGMLDESNITIGKQAIPQLQDTVRPFFSMGSEGFSTFPGIPEQENVANRVKKSNFISFYGGGAVLAYSFEAERFHSAVSETENTTSSQQGAASSSTMRLTAILANLEEQRFNSLTNMLTMELETSTRYSQSSEVGFALSDSTVGDAFNVQVYLDRKSRTFGFKTLFGRSTCPHEENTDFREKPKIFFEQINVTDAHPGVPVEFQAEIRNDGDDPSVFELFTYPDTLKGNDVKVLVNGKNIVGLPLTFEEIAPRQQVPIKVQIVQGPTLGDVFPEVSVTIGVRSRCESSSFNPLLRARRSMKLKRQAPFLRAGDATSDEQDLFIRFLRQCPRIEWAGDLARPDASPAISGEATQSILLAVRNLASKRWADLTQVQSVGFQYRFRSELTHTTTNWELLRAGASPINLVPSETLQTRFAAFSWNMTALSEDGVVEIRAVVSCTNPPVLSPHHDELGIAFSQSEVKSVKIDRTRPKLFSSALVNQGKLILGQPIQLDFDEPLRCPLLYAEISVDSLSETLRSGTELLLLCKANQVQIQLDRTRVTLLNYEGRSARFKLYNVMDLLGNKLSAGGSNSTGELDLRFDFSQSKKKDYSIQGLLVNGVSDVGNGFYVPGTPFHQEVVSNITALVAQQLQIAEDQIKVVRFTFIGSTQLRADLLIFAASEDPSNQRRRLADGSEDLGLLLKALVDNSTIQLDRFDLETSGSYVQGSAGQIELQVDSNAQVVLGRVAQFQSEASLALKQSADQSQAEFQRLQDAVEQGLESVLDHLQETLDSLSPNHQGGRRLASEPPTNGASNGWILLIVVSMLALGVALGRWTK